MRRLFVRFVLLLLLMTAHAAFAQQTDAPTDSLVKHLNYYSAQKSNTLMFVHMDKTVYLPNEIVWFTAYILNGLPADLPKHQVLSAALISNNDQVVAVQSKFVMTGGRAFGSMAIPDSIPPGNYSFIAYTNRLVSGQPDAYFVQPVTLKTADQPSFNVDLALDTLYKDPLNMRAILQADIKSVPVDGAGITYYLGKDQKTGLAGKAKTNVLGNYMLMIPKNKVNPAQHTLEVDVKYNKEVKTLYLPIPVKQQFTNVRFYPEGGHLINGMVNRVGWEVRTATGTPIKTEAILYGNNKVIDTIATDSYGMGSFGLRPVEKMVYTVKLLQNNTDASVYTLPVALAAGATLYMANALVNDTLRLQLRSNYTGPLYLLVHDYKSLFTSVMLKATANGRTVKINLLDIPRGLNTVTVLDSLQRPLAERLFFAHYDRQPRVVIANDNKEPGTREKMKVSIKLTGADGKPASGIVSVACVQDNRLEVKNANNINQYVYLQHEIDDIPLKDDLLGNTETDRNYLNELLLIRGWSKYQWPEVLRATSKDTLKKSDSLVFGGNIAYYDKPLKKPVSFVMMKDSSGMELLQSTDKGLFTFANFQIYSQPEKKVSLIVNGHSQDYQIKVNDPYLAYNKALAKQIVATRYELPLNQNTQEFVIKGFEHATNLHEVKILANKNDFLRGPGPGGFNSNACGDYICLNRILNCSNHRNDPGNRAPAQGEMVHMGGRGLIPYFGCSVGPVKEGMLSFTGIYTAKTFYGADYSYINPTEPDYISTIFWKHSLIIDPNKEAEISFYTSDITGKFRIVVQGITTGDVVYGEDSFTVKKKAVQK
jgi:hypothetical protein